MSSRRRWRCLCGPFSSSPDYRAKFAAVPVRRGRPKAKATKVPIGLRLAPDIVKSFEASGPGYNQRATGLRKAGFGAQDMVAAVVARLSTPRASLGPRRRSPACWMVDHRNSAQSSAARLATSSRARMILRPGWSHSGCRVSDQFGLARPTSSRRSGSSRITPYRCPGNCREMILAAVSRSHAARRSCFALSLGFARLAALASFARWRRNRSPPSARTFLAAYAPSQPLIAFHFLVTIKPRFLSSSSGYRPQPSVVVDCHLVDLDRILRRCPRARSRPPRRRRRSVQRPLASSEKSLAGPTR